MDFFLHFRAKMKSDRGYFTDLIYISVSAAIPCIYYGLWPADHNWMAMLSVFCFGPYFAWARAMSVNMAKVMGGSVIYFVIVGCAIALHFGLDIFYGLSIGVIQGVIMGASIHHANAFYQKSDLKWILCVVIPWMCMTYVVCTIYGIAVTLPIQLYRFPLFLQPISIFGAYSVEMLLITTNVVLGGIRSRSSLFVLVSVYLGWVGIGMFLWTNTTLSLDHGLKAKVATISPGRIPHEQRESDLINLTRNAVVHGANFVVWPEVYILPTDYPYQPCEEYVSQHIAPILSVNAFVVVGCLQAMDNIDCPMANLAITVDPSGKVIGVYGKQHPVGMIGEKSCIKNGYREYFVPPDLLGYSNREISPSFSTLICYDMDFADSTATVADMGVSLILNPSEDWAKARGHFAASVFRAIENRVTVAKCDWGWDSAIISPMGEIVNMYNSEQLHRGTLLADVILNARSTGHRYYTQHILPWLCVSACVMYLLVAGFRFARNFKSRPQPDMERALLL